MNKKYCVCGDLNAAASLSFYGYTVFVPESENSLPRETRTHTDMLVLPLTDNSAAVHAGQKKLIADMVSAGIRVYPVDAVLGEYPLDCAFNLALTKNFALGHEKAVLPEIKTLLDREFIPVKQGYAKCSTAFAGENAVITENKGIAEIFEKKGFDTLIIGSGDVYLSPRHYGFFGGATGAPDTKTLFINGSPDFHRDGGRIKEFLARHGVEIKTLHDGKIKDIGSVFFFEGK